MKENVTGNLNHATIKIIMRNLVLILFTAWLGVVSAQTNISGLISASTTWTSAGNPYIITGNTVLAQTATLSIQPGVVIKFNQGTTLAVLGELQAIGTVQDSIVFTSNAVNPAPKDFLGITFSSESLDYNSNDQTGCILKYCLIEYTGNDDNFNHLGSGAINIDRSSPSIQNTTIRYNSVGICAEGQGNSICYIQQNNLHSNERAGIFLDVSWEAGNGSQPAHIIGNKISNNGIGISLNWLAGNPLIEGNIVTSNASSGIYSEYSYPYIQRNLIFGNGGAITADVANGGSVRILNNLIITNNSFGCPLWFMCEGSAVVGFGYISAFSGNQLVDNQFTNSLIHFNRWGISNVAVEHNTIVRNDCVELLPYDNNNAPSFGILLNMNDISLVSQNNIEEGQYGLPTRSITSADNLNATENWWGTIDDLEIREQIFDFFDSSALGIVSYAPYNDSPVTDAPVIPPVNVRKVDLENGNVKLCWDSNLETDLAGYKVYFGNPTGYSFSDFVDVGNVSSYILSGASINDSIAITAYDNLADGFEDMFDGNESWFTYAVDVSLNPYFSSSSNNLIVDFENLSTHATSVVWDFGDGNTSNDGNPQHEFAEPGIYEVCLTVGNGCAGTETVCQSITVTCPVPYSDFNYIADELQVSFTDNSSGADFWTWDFGDGNSVTGQNVSHTFSASESYQVCLIAENECGTDSLCQEINVSCMDDFDLLFTGELLFCDGDSILLEALPGQLGYEWSSGETGHSIFVDQSGMYYATAVSVPQGCDLFSDTVTIEVVVLTPNISINGAEIETGVFNSYQWLLDGNEITGAIGQSLTPLVAGDYQVLVSDGNGCSAISAVLYFVPGTVGMNEQRDMPFSVYPNPTNGMFRLDMKQSKAYSVEVYNALGQSVFHQQYSPANVALIELNSTGVYHLRVYIEDDIYVLIVVKE